MLIDESLFWLLKNNKFEGQLLLNVLINICENSYFHVQIKSNKTLSIDEVVKKIICSNGRPSFDPLRILTFHMRQ